MSTYRYISEFGSRDGHAWRAVVDRISDDGSDAVVIAASDFDFDLQAAVINWKQTEKWEPLQGSSCSLRVVSPGDRTFIDLYAAKPGDVLLRLYRDDTLYWTGTLDPEFYQEPYTSMCNYEVELTFSDLGALDRLAYNGPASGHVRFDYLIGAALSAASLPSDYTLHTGLAVPGSPATPLQLQDMRVAGANFIDEEGEPLKWQEVIEGILQPFGLRLVQQDGAFIVYDLYTARDLTSVPIEWDGDDASLGVDKVYNNIEVEFSPYEDSAATNSEIKYEGLSDFMPTWLIYNRKTNPTYDGFWIQLSGHEGYPTIADNSLATTYKINSIYSGEDGAGIAGKIGGPAIVAGGLSGEASSLPLEFGCCYWAGKVNDTYSHLATLFTALKADFSPSLEGSASHIKVCLTMMMDGRYNPFEDAKDNCKNRADTLKNWFRTIYVPVKIWFELPDGTQITYRNYATMNSSTNAAATGWFEAAPKWGDAWLCYYDWTDRKKNSPCNGWMTNRPCIGQNTDQIPELWQKRGDGEFLPIPGKVLVQGGKLTIEVGTGVFSWDTNAAASVNIENGKYVLTLPQWLLYKKLSVEVVDKYGKAVESEDVVRETVLNPHSKDPLTINTICGTPSGTGPTARGAILLSGAGLGKLTRGELTDTAENLLIAAIASQYDSRHTTLSGTVAADSFGGMYALFTDRAQPSDRLFLPDQAEYDVQSGEINATFVELSAQKYIPKVLSSGNSNLFPSL